MKNFLTLLLALALVACNNGEEASYENKQTTIVSPLKNITEEVAVNKIISSGGENIDRTLLEIRQGQPDHFQWSRFWELMIEKSELVPKADYGVLSKETCSVGNTLAYLSFVFDFYTDQGFIIRSLHDHYKACFAFMEKQHLEKMNTELEESIRDENIEDYANLVNLISEKTPFYGQGDPDSVFPMEQVKHVIARAITTSSTSTFLKAYVTASKVTSTLLDDISVVPNAILNKQDVERILASAGLKESIRIFTLLVGNNDVSFTDLIQILRNKVKSIQEPHKIKSYDEYNSFLSFIASRAKNNDEMTLVFDEASIFLIELFANERLFEINKNVDQSSKKTAFNYFLKSLVNPDHTGYPVIVKDNTFDKVNELYAKIMLSDDHSKRKETLDEVEKIIPTKYFQKIDGKNYEDNETGELWLNISSYSVRFYKTLRIENANKLNLHSSDLYGGFVDLSGKDRTDQISIPDSFPELNRHAIPLLYKGEDGVHFAITLPLVFDNDFSWDWSNYPQYQPQSGSRGGDLYIKEGEGVIHPILISAGGKGQKGVSPNMIGFDYNADLNLDTLSNFPFLLDVKDVSEMNRRAILDTVKRPRKSKAIKTYEYLIENSQADLQNNYEVYNQMLGNPCATNDELAYCLSKELRPVIKNYRDNSNLFQSHVRFPGFRLNVPIADGARGQSGNIIILDAQ